MAGPAGGASAGANYDGNVNADQDYGGKDYREQSYATQESVNRADARATQRAFEAQQRQTEIAADKLAEEQRIKALGTTGPLKTNYKTSYFQNLRNKSIQKALDRNKVLAMRKMNLMEKGLPGMYGNLTEEELVGISTSGPYLAQQKTKADVSKFASGKDLLSRVTEGQSILDTDNFPQSEYERLFPSNLNVGGGGGGNRQNEIPYIPGPGDTGDEGGEEETTYDYRLGNPNENQALDVTLGRYFNQGGRVPRNMGGIMNAVPRQGYFLGKIVKGVGKAIGSVADAAGKVLKSDVGKMALLAAGAYYMPGYGIKATGGFSNMMGADGFFKTAGKKLLLKDGMNFGDKGALSLSKILGLSGILPLIPGLNDVKQDPSLMATRKDTGLIDPLTGEEGTPASMRANIENAKIEAGGDPIKLAALNAKYNNMLFTNLPYENYATYAQGGRIRAQEGGLMNLGGMEKDYRAEGGFVPIGKQEKADDVPARLSVNEFVFTADAVRNAGGGDIDKGAEVMENMMKNLENGGTVSEESQGNTGAQDMFSVSERIGEVI